MKRTFIWLTTLTLILTFAFPIFAICETQAAEPEALLSWTDVVTQIVIWTIGVVATLLSAGLAFVFTKYIMPWLKNIAIPWLEQKKLLKAAETAVELAEAVFGRFNGEDKWELALHRLDEQGYDIDSSDVLAAIQAAWTKLDISQYAAGIKKAITDAGEIEDEPVAEEQPEQTE